MPTRLHPLSLLLLFTLLSYSLCQYYDIYVDAKNKNRNKDGSSSNPYNNFLGVESHIANALSSGFSYINIKVYVRYNSNPYSVPSYSYTVPSNTVFDLKFINWDPFDFPQSLGDCDNLPQLYFEDGGWSLSNLGDFIVNGLVITSRGNAAVNLKQASSFQITNACLDHSVISTQSLINATNVTNLLAHSVVMAARSGTSIIHFENSLLYQNVQVKIKEVVMVFISFSECPDIALNSALYFYTAKSSQIISSTISANDIAYMYKSELDAHPQAVVLCSPGLKVNGFTEFYLDNFKMNQQTLIPKTSSAHLVHSKMWILSL